MNIWTPALMALGQYFVGLTSKELDVEKSKWPKETVELWERLSKKEANGKSAVLCEVV